MIRTIRATLMSAAAVAVAVTGLAVVANPAQADVARNQIATLNYSAINYYLAADTGHTTSYPQAGTIVFNPCSGTFTGTGTLLSPSPALPTSTTGFFISPTEALFFVSYAIEPGYQVVGDVIVNPDGSFSGTWSDNYSLGHQSGDVVSGAPVETFSTYAIHGQYVKANKGADDAAHSCIGMPVQSRK